MSSGRYCLLVISCLLLFLHLRDQCNVILRCSLRFFDADSLGARRPHGRPHIRRCAARLARWRRCPHGSTTRQRPTGSQRGGHARAYRRGRHPGLPPRHCRGRHQGVLHGCACTVGRRKAAAGALCVSLPPTPPLGGPPLGQSPVFAAAVGVSRGRRPPTIGPGGGRVVMHAREPWAMPLGGAGGRGGGVRVRATPVDAPRTRRRCRETGGDGGCRVLFCSWSLPDAAPGAHPPVLPP